jgi:hypothetical protein
MSIHPDAASTRVSMPSLLSDDLLLPVVSAAATAALIIIAHIISIWRPPNSSGVSIRHAVILRISYNDPCII